MADDAPLLDLQTLVERPRITIDGKAYEILSHDELSVLDFARFQRWGRRLDELMAAEVSDDDAELTEIVRSVSERILVGVPQAVRAQLSDAQRLAVIEVFTTLRTRSAIQRFLATGASSTGATPSRGSSASTAARHAGGSSARRSRSSKPT